MPNAGDRRNRPSPVTARRSDRPDAPGWAEELAAALGVREVEGLRRLSGWASRETWAFDADGRPLILQRARPGNIGGLDTGTEVRLLRAARSAGVPVPPVAAFSVEAGLRNRSR